MTLAVSPNLAFASFSGQVQSSGAEASVVPLAAEASVVPAAVERVTLHTTAAIIEGPARLGPVADPDAVRAAILRWAGALYETDAAKRAWMDARVLQSPESRVLQNPAAGQETSRG